MTDSNILLFVATSLIVILVPGQDMVLVMSHGMAQGSRAGLITAAGVSVGHLGHTILAALGLCALLKSSEFLFDVLKYIGAAYLAYLGLRLIFTRQDRLDISGSGNATLSRLFVTGALSNLSNPKITVFYFAFLPQFVPAGIDNPWVYLVALGSGFSLLTFLLKAPLGVFSGLASAWVTGRPIVISMINAVSGVVLIGLGVKLAMDQQ